MKNIFRSKLIIAAVTLAGVFAAFGAVQQVSAQTLIEDCSDNSIIKCGVTSPADLIKKIKANKPSDLKAIYESFELAPKDYDAFAKEAVVGTAYKDGTIKVNGHIVATDIWSIGRNAKPYSEGKKIDGITYHKSKAQDVFARDSMPVFVWFDDKGSVETAILQPCGNPVGGKTPTPEYECKELVRKTVSGKKNTYDFSTNAPASKGATISKVVYDFGDGSAKVTKTNPSDTVRHTYTKPGNYDAKVTVYAKLPSGKEVVANSTACVSKVTVEEEKTPEKPVAAWQCTGLVGTAQTESDNSFAYTFRANASMTNARLIKADFDFGDASTVAGVKPAGVDSNTVSTNHTYAQAGTYKAKATLYFEAINGAKAPGNSTSVTCETQITLTKPEVLPTPPAELPKTGAAGAIGLFSGASVLGSLGYRWRISRRSNKIDDLISRLKG